MNEVAAFFHSSLSCAGSDVIASRLQGFVADTVAHIGIAGILTSLVIFRDWPILAILGWIFGNHSQGARFRFAKRRMDRAGHV